MSARPHSDDLFAGLDRDAVSPRRRSKSRYSRSMTTIPQRDLRNHNAQIIERVIAGESFTVTRDGVPVADVVPHKPQSGPPMFRRADDLPTWTPLSTDDAEALTAELRDLGRDEPRDPWTTA